MCKIRPKKKEKHYELYALCDKIYKLNYAYLRRGARHMNRIWRAVSAALLASAMCLCLTGCLDSSAEELYRLPKAAEGYIQIQDVIDGLQKNGLEFAAPLSGYNRQAVQLHDLDGDGKEEAVAFMRSRDAAPLKVYLLKYTEESYKVASVLEGEGTNVESVSYADMDGNGTLELIIGWQMSSNVKQLGVYSVRDFVPVSLLSAPYTGYLLEDMNEDGKKELVLLNAGNAETAGTAALYHLMEDGEMMFSESFLSLSAESTARLQFGLLSDEKPAVFIDSVCGNGLITDVMVFRDDALSNITLNTETQNSDTERTYSVYCTDMDGDGVMEIPDPFPVFQQSETAYHLIRWITATSRGFISQKHVTYHNYSDGWFFTLPEMEPGSLTVRREDRISGERAVVFSQVAGSEEDPEILDFMIIYTLTGDNKEERADAEGRFRLFSGSSKIFAARLEENGTIMLSEDDVKQGFSLIYSDWLTGSN